MEGRAKKAPRTHAGVRPAQAARCQARLSRSATGLLGASKAMFDGNGAKEGRPERLSV